MSSVLLLNASYEPLSVLSLRRAVALWLRGQVLPATDDKISLRSCNDAMGIPTVLRLRRYVNAPRRGVTWSRRAVLVRDSFRCIYCGVGAGEMSGGQILHKDDFTLDHIVPRSRGGENTWGNTACACQRCNQRKGDRTPHEAGMPLRWEPKTPRVGYLVVSGDMPAAWKVYLEVG
jgi:hypothetical protein